MENQYFVTLQYQTITGEHEDNIPVWAASLAEAQDKAIKIWKDNNPHVMHIKVISIVIA